MSYDPALGLCSFGHPSKAQFIRQGKIPILQTSLDFSQIGKVQKKLARYIGKVLKKLDK
jgi:hypothetical protein